MLRRIGLALAAIALLLPLRVSAQKSGRVIFYATVVINAIAQHITQTKKHFDAIAQIVSSEEIDSCQPG